MVRLTGCDELPFGVTEQALATLVRQPVGEQREPGHRDQRRGVAAMLLPDLGGTPQLAQHGHVITVVLKPADQPLPMTEQGQVADPHGVFDDGQHSHGHERVQHRTGARVDARQRHGLAGHHIAGRAHQAEEQPLGGVLLGGVERQIDLLGQMLDRRRDPADAVVVIQGESLPAAEGPDHQQRVREQWQRPRRHATVGRARGELVQQHADEVLLDLHAEGDGGLNDHVAQLAARHRRQQERTRHRRFQDRLHGGGRERVRAQADHHHGTPGEPRQFDQRPLASDGRQHQCVLEVVDHDQTRRRQVVQLDGLRGDQLLDSDRAARPADQLAIGKLLAEQSGRQDR